MLIVPDAPLGHWVLNHALRMLMVAQTIYEVDICKLKRKKQAYCALSYTIFYRILEFATTLYANFNANYFTIR